jgi:hypothetical protein
MNLGKVTALNPGRRRFAVAIQDGTYAVFQLREPVAVQVGNEVSGSLTERGLQTLQLVPAKLLFQAFNETGTCNIALVEKILADEP